MIEALELQSATWPVVLHWFRAAQRFTAGMRIYFLGICGTAMGNAALLARSAGHEVSGADEGIFPPMSDVLAEAGIASFAGYDAARLAQLAPDLVVIGNALSRGNPEIEWLLDTRSLPFVSLPAFLHDQVLAKRQNIVIAGTHGKTTTTAITAHLLRTAGFDPGFMIGGVPFDPPIGQHLGALDAPFVIEGDEYDSAFFDKRSKFIHYAPRIAVLNNLEFDHADIFRDLADVQRTFLHFCRIVPRSGWIVLNGDDANIAELGPFNWTQVLRVGTGAHNDVCLQGYREDETGATFSLTWKGRLWGEVRWALPGEFNARNATMAATAAALAVLPQDPLTFSLAGLASFRGVKRRQEARLARPGLTIIEDFGHHPTAIMGTLKSLRARYPGRRVVAAFEPRSNTARTNRLQAAFSAALAHADEVYLGAVNRAEKLAVAERFDPSVVVAELQGKGVVAQAFADNATLGDVLCERIRPGGADAPSSVVVLFSNGSFDGVIGRVVQAGAEQS